MSTRYLQSSNGVVRDILRWEKVAEGEMGSDEFMCERGQSDSSY